jgi:hypothetical protein
MNLRLMFTFIVGITAIVHASEKSDDVFYEEVPSGPQTIAEAKARGKDQAQKDIKAGRFRVYDYGRPARPHETDKVTGYEIEYLGQPTSWGNIRIMRDEELKAYNRAMREWCAKHKKRK